MNLSNLNLSNLSQEEITNTEGGFIAMIIIEISTMLFVAGYSVGAQLAQLYPKKDYVASVA